MQSILKKILPHLLVFAGFIILSLAYFSPVLQGKEILQSDIVQYNAMAKQQRDFKAETGEETYWTNSAFGGMPTYQLGARYPHHYIKKLDLALRFLPRPADYLLLYFVSFYILLLSLKVNFKLAALGALAFGFSTYLVIILGVGHNSKAHAIAYMPLVISGILLTFQRKYSLGFIVTALAMGLQLVANHFQMTYYLMLLVIVIGIVYLIDAYKKKVLPHFFKSIGILMVAVILAVGMNAANILATQEYVKESTRGQSEITINPDGSPKAAETGLPKEKITEYSYGGLETFNLFIPRLLGGGMSENVGEDSAFYDFYLAQGASPAQAKEAAESVPTYWGDQPIVEAPAYVGAVILFLFVFGLFLVKGRLKWWLVAGTLMSLLLSYGKNFGFLTDFFIDFVPLYDKFRAVTSIQVILELCIPVLAIFALVRLFNDYGKDEDKIKALKFSVLITAGMAVIFLISRYTGILGFNFEGARDASFKANYGKPFLDAIVSDRKMIFTKDTLRSLLLVLLSAITIYSFLKKKLSEVKVIIVFALLIVFDQVGVDRRYVNTENFVASRYVQKPFQTNKADKKIFSDNGHFRVYDISSGEGRASAQKVKEMTSGSLSAPYFHNTLNGYHAAKLKRFDALYDFYISRNNMNVLNMLNTKYIIAEDESQKPYPYLNEEANGNAWFIEVLQKVGSANDEILALEKIDNKKLAVYTSDNTLHPIYKLDSLASIKVVDYEPNYIKYESFNNNDGFAVFSEVYYGNGWKASIDDKSVPIQRVNYILRGLEIPKGKHTIVFKFEPEVVKTGSTIALASVAVLFLLLLGGLFYEFKNKKVE
ncbi:YfhO family protein [Lacinutrix sp. Hel_I_90]|uniref:YfhO family protein n=1 Tax=Lacinutrix sp. Hel_I_90 TaxID=1249999 RepID=UPI0005C9899B|nr:YfhO family protein [Lacinutrix sp. Hel_I_90]